MIYDLIIIFLILGFILERILDYLNIRNWRKEVPGIVMEIYDPEKYRKAREYAVANYRFTLAYSLFMMLLMLFLLVSGSFGRLDVIARLFATDPVLIAIIFFALIGLLSDLLTLPFSVYKTFVLEEKFGFNKTTAGTFILDKLKGYFLAIIIGGALIFLLVRAYQWMGTDFWWMAWLIMTALMIFGTMFFSSLILPLFNKLTPLDAGNLRTAIEDYSNKNKFPVREIYVMDGSKRSSKSNAFFTGLGKRKKIVLFDTLIEKHTVEELVAVLAHEIGHFKKKHIVYGLLAGILQTGIMFFIFSRLQGNLALSEALGAEEPGIHIELLAFGLLYSPVSLLVGILMHVLSRKFEFEADEFASKTYDGLALSNALKRLSADNLSNLTPHPAYVFVHYSHPPLLERLKAISNYRDSGVGS